MGVSLRLMREFLGFAVPDSLLSTGAAHSGVAGRLDGVSHHVGRIYLGTAEKVHLRCMCELERCFTSPGGCMLAWLRWDRVCCSSRCARLGIHIKLLHFPACSDRWRVFSSLVIVTPLYVSLPSCQEGFLAGWVSGWVDGVITHFLCGCVMYRGVTRVYVRMI